MIDTPNQPIVRILCDICGGVGIIIPPLSEHMKEKCRNCNGKGYIKVKKPLFIDCAKRQ